MKKCVLIVGQKLSSFTNYLEEHGYDYIVLRDSKRTKFPDRRFKRRLLCDFSSKETIVASLQQITQPVDCVVTTYETYVLPTALIADYLQLPGMPIMSAEACTDKFLMRSLFADAPEKISPDFALVASINDVQRFAEAHSFPLVLKPANLAKSLLVTKNNSLPELLANYQKAIRSIGLVYKKYAPDRQPKLLVEEFMSGTVHSVDAFVDSSGTPHVLDQIVDYQTGYDIGFDDNFHYSRTLPSKLAASNQAGLRHCAKLGIKSLGMKNSAAHVEIIMTEHGPRIVEIGARNGGYRERMHHLANGIDVTGAMLSLALGQSPPIKVQRDDSCVVVELFPKTAGLFAGLHNEEAVRQLSSFVQLSIRPHIGDSVGKAADGHKMCAFIIIHNSDEAQFMRDLEFVNTQVYVFTK